MSISISVTAIAGVGGGYDLKLKHIALGGEAAHNIFIEDCELITYYGTSECGCDPCKFVIDRPYAEVPLGKPFTNLQYKIRPLENSESNVGELIIKLPYFRGYINMPEATKRVLVDGWYSTGDIVRKLEDGNLFLLGRVDNMLNINGNRVDPEEIEAVATRVLGLQDAAVKGYGDEKHTRLCLYYINSSELDSHKASEILAKYLPYYMLPNQYIRLEQFPRLPGGKINRNALKVPELSKNSTSFAIPNDELEEALCNAFAKALNLDNFSADDDFYLLGGDSLSMITAIEESNIPGLNMYDMLNGRTPRKVAECYQIRAAKENQDIESENKKAMQKAQPLTAWQQHALKYRSLKPQSALYDLCTLSRFSKRMDMKRLEDAVNRMCYAHPALMTILSKDADGILKQSYHPELCVPVKTEYVSDKEFMQIRETLVKPLDVYGSMPYTIRLFSTESTDYFFIQINHTITDGTSFNIMFDDVMRAYRGEALMTDCYYLMLQMQEQQKTTSFYKEAQEYYKQRYGKKVYDIRPKEDGNGENLGNAYFDFLLNLPAEKIKQMSNIHRISETALFATALGLSVALYNGCLNVLTAWVHHGRKSAIDSRIVGMCYKNLPLALELTAERTFSEIYADVRNQMVKAMTYDCYAYNKIDVPPIKGDKAVFLFQKGIYDVYEDVQSNISMIPEPLKNLYERNSGALVLEIMPSNSKKATCKIEYNSDMYQETSIRHFSFIFTQVVTLMLDYVEDEGFTFGMLQERIGV